MTGPNLKPDQTLVHATCLSFGGAGILLLGPPGSGKSDLALRLIDQPGVGTSGLVKRAMLISDDEVMVRRQGDGLIAEAPAPIAGMLEVRGLGIVSLAAEATAKLVLAVKLVAAATIERLPELELSRFELLGLSLPLVEIDAAQASAPARVRAALDWFHRP